MKYVLNQDKLIDVMLNYSKKHCPEISEPLHSKLKNTGRGNSGWGSSMHDFNYYKLYYYAYNGEVVLYEDDGRDNTRWNFNSELPGLQTMYDLFGEEPFERFFLVVHNIDIKDKK